MFFPHTQDIVKPYPRKTKVSLRNYPDQNSKCPGEMNSSSSIPNGSCKLRNKLACTQHTFLTTTFPLPSLLSLSSPPLALLLPSSHPFPSSSSSNLSSLSLSHFLSEYKYRYRDRRTIIFLKIIKIIF
jgi:hypothetical protein